MRLSLCLSFCVSVLPPVLNCQVGRSLPVFLSPTPPHRSVLQATVGQNFQLTAAAQAPGAQYVWLKEAAAGRAGSTASHLFLCPLLCPEGSAVSRSAAPPT